MSNSIDTSCNKAKEYVNDVLEIYTSPEYIRTLKESNYSFEEIKEFLKDIACTSKECFNNVRDQQLKLMSIVLDNKDNKTESQPIHPVESKYILSSLSQNDYRQTVCVNV